MRKSIILTSAITGEEWLIPVDEIHHCKALNEKSVEKAKADLVDEKPIQFSHEPATSVWFDYQCEGEWSRIYVTESLKDIDYLIN